MREHRSKLRVSLNLVDSTHLVKGQTLASGKQCKSESDELDEREKLPDGINRRRSRCIRCLDLATLNFLSSLQVRTGVDWKILQDALIVGREERKRCAVSRFFAKKLRLYPSLLANQYESR